MTANCLFLSIDTHFPELLYTDLLYKVLLEGPGNLIIKLRHYIRNETWLGPEILFLSKWQENTPQWADCRLTSVLPHLWCHDWLLSKSLSLEIVLLVYFSRQDCVYVCMQACLYAHPRYSVIQTNSRTKKDGHLDRVHIKSHLCQATAGLSAMIYLLTI